MDVLRSPPRVPDTDLLTDGENVLCAQVAEGWFAGRLGSLGGQRDI
jgi:alpha-L-rhamnosidase